MEVQEPQAGDVSLTPLGIGSSGWRPGFHYFTRRLGLPLPPCLRLRDSIAAASCRRDRECSVHPSCLGGCNRHSSLPFRLTAILPPDASTAASKWHFDPSACPSHFYLQELPLSHVHFDDYLVLTLAVLIYSKGAFTTRGHGKTEALPFQKTRRLKLPLQLFFSDASIVDPSVSSSNTYYLLRSTSRRCFQDPIPSRFFLQPQLLSLPSSIALFCLPSFSPKVAEEFRPTVFPPPQECHQKHCGATATTTTSTIDSVSDTRRKRH